jgi:hypothetical protein
MGGQSAYQATSPFAWHNWRQGNSTLAVSDQADILSVADRKVEERRDTSPDHNGIELRRTSHHECESTETNRAVEIVPRAGCGNQVAITTCDNR